MHLKCSVVINFYDLTISVYQVHIYYVWISDFITIMYYDNVHVILCFFALSVETGWKPSETEQRWVLAHKLIMLCKHFDVHIMHQNSATD